MFYFEYPTTDTTLYEGTITSSITTGLDEILEVSKNIIAILGSEKPSEFRLNQLRQSISLEEAKNITYKEIYFCHLNISISIYIDGTN